VASEVWSLRQFLQAVGRWPDDLPSNGNNTLMVAGLEGSLDLLTPEDAETWLGDAVKQAILSFQDAYDGQAALTPTAIPLWRISKPFPPAPTVGQRPWVMDRPACLSAA